MDNGYNTNANNTNNEKNSNKLEINSPNKKN